MWKVSTFFLLELYLSLFKGFKSTTPSRKKQQSDRSTFILRRCYNRSMKTFVPNHLKKLNKSKHRKINKIVNKILQLPMANS